MNAAPAPLEFFDCVQLRRGAPLVCSLHIGGRRIEGRFDPSPLAYRSGYLAPKRVSGWRGTGYALSFIDPDAMQVRVIGRVLRYMRLVAVQGDVVTYAPRAAGDARALLTIAADRMRVA